MICLVRKLPVAVRRPPKIKPNLKNKYMFKDELIKTVATATQASAKSVEQTLNTLLEAITEALKKGEEVKLIGFGTFKTHRRKARIGKNPRTGAKINIAAKTAPKFVPGAKLVKAIK